MGTPFPPNTPVLMVALTVLSQAAWSGRLPNVGVNEAFWCSPNDAPGLISAGYAELAPEGTIAPPPEPRFTAHGSPGFGAGTSNASH